MKTTMLKKAEYIFCAVVIMFSLTSCKNFIGDMLKQFMPDLNKTFITEVGDENMYLSNRTEYGCSGRGMTKVVTMPAGQKLATDLIVKESYRLQFGNQWKWFRGQLFEIRNGVEERLVDLNSDFSLESAHYNKYLHCYVLPLDEHNVYKGTTIYEWRVEIKNIDLQTTFKKVFSYTVIGK